MTPARPGAAGRPGGSLILPAGPACHGADGNGNDGTKETRNA